MSRHRLLDSNPQRERRRQLILLDRLSRTAERMIAKEIADTSRELIKAWEVTGNVPEASDHRRRIDSLLKRVWRASVEGMAKRINEAAKAKGQPSVTKQEAKWDLFVEEYIAAYGAEKVAQVSRTTIDQIKTQISVARREGIGQQEIAKRINAAIGAISLQRAAVIARTETHSAGNYGSLKQAEDTGLKMRREWIAANQPGRTRSSHLEADGQVVGVDEPFDVNGFSLMYPGDPSGPAEEVINCRCAVGYVVED